MLEDLKKSLADNKDLAIDPDRNATFRLAETLQVDLERMKLELKECIEKLEGALHCALGCAHPAAVDAETGDQPGADQSVSGLDYRRN